MNGSPSRWFLFSAHRVSRLTCSHLCGSKKKHWERNARGTKKKSLFDSVWGGGWGGGGGKGLGGTTEVWEDAGALRLLPDDL